MLNFNSFFSKLKTAGLEYFGLYYGYYYAKVIDNKDPENLNRLKFDCEELGLRPDFWAFPSLGVSAGHGARSLPAVGDNIRIKFKNGNQREVTWELGQTPKGNQIPEATDADKHVFKSPGGVLVLIDDTDKSIGISTPDGLKISLKSGVIELAGSGLSQYSVKGQSLQAQLNIDAARLAALIAAIQAAPVVPGDGGTAFKAAIVAAISGVPGADYSNVLSSEVKNS